ncbi:hypothetical protein FOE78_02975 [Microlunatus elymi]|uniref:Uncharacterized protein n=1 Tax=Microlunatus elymi TaxID=2596828 RepID=A0A516PUZ7_9ACTN|nr:hypothetical protein [Microlunatus elymi]QDP95015.1 hypothetical protein FOE78_02975 [Microlunatus elymi]
MKVRSLAAVAACVALMITGCSALPQRSSGDHHTASAGPVAGPSVTASGAGGGTTPSPTGGGATSPASPSSSAAAPPSDPVREFDGASTADPADFPGTVTKVGFSTPSRNISCGMHGSTVVCQLQQFDYHPTPTRDCRGGGNWGSQVHLIGAGSAAFGCAGDVESGGPQLPYGAQLKTGVVRCVSREDGVTCQNTSSGNGFRVSRQGFVFFPTRESSNLPAALVGQWDGHGRRLVIKESGASVLTYRAYRYCSDDPTKPCDKVKGNVIYPGGKVKFTLQPGASTISASGKITSSNDPAYPVGATATVTVSGYQRLLRLAGKTFANFCAPGDPNLGECGA